MRQRVEVIDPANQCERCPHALVRLGSGTMWCPCEDCHPGGRIQGREPKGAANFDAAIQRAFEGTGVEVRTSFTPSDTEEDPLWVDPVHSV